MGTVSFADIGVCAVIVGFTQLPVMAQGFAGGFLHCDVTDRAGLKYIAAKFTGGIHICLRILTIAFINVRSIS